jgi:hypothetical protein
VEVIGFFHYGIAVPDLKTAAFFFENVLNLKASSQRTVEEPYLSNLVGIDRVKAEIIMYALGNNSYLELLEWERQGMQLPMNDFMPSSEQIDLASKGVQHLCIYVDDADAYYERLSHALNVKMISESVVIIPIGPNKGAKVFFVQALGFLFLEIFEKALPQKVT